MLIGAVEATIALLLLIVVLGPTLAERLRIPGIVGLIAGGMIFGPFVIGWLESGSALWDSRWLVHEQSWFGQLLHALFGYVAKQDPEELDAGGAWVRFKSRRAYFFVQKFGRMTVEF